MIVFLRMGIISMLLLFLLVFIPETRAWAQPSAVPVGSFPDIFSYYNPSDINTPAGAYTTSKSIILLQAYEEDHDSEDDDSEEDYYDSDLFGVTSSTTFLIRTFRDDNKICMCLTGHQIKNLFRNGAQPIVGSSVHFNADIYMNYLGSDSIAQVNGYDYHFNKKATPFNKGYLSTGQLVAYEYGAGNYDPDIALVLVDKRKFPSPFFTTLGYDFADAAWDSNTYYSIGHPHAYPQMIMDGYSVSDQGTSVVSLTREPPGYGSGPGASGAPILKRPTSPSFTSYVRGVYHAKPANTTTRTIKDLFGTNRRLEYDYDLQFTKIGQIEHAIRQHCWQNKTASEILSGGLHKEAVQIDNSSGISPYTQNQSLTSATAAASSVAGFTEYINDNTKATYLKANQCNISGFTLPAIYPGSTYSWQLTVAAKEINVNAGFDYTATGSSELHLASVIIGSTTSAVSKRLPEITNLSQQVIDTATTGFAVYPNPSSSGVFYLSLPADNDGNGYHLKVFGTDGRQVYQGVIQAAQSTYRFSLTNLSRGAYILGVYRQRTGEKIFSKTIIY